MTTPAPLQLVVGDDWSIPITLVDTNGAAVNLTGASIGADYYQAPAGPPYAMSVGNGNIVLTSSSAGQCTLVVPRSVTKNAFTQAPNARVYPTRLQVYLTDSAGHQQTYAILPIIPIDPRNADLAQPPTLRTVLLSPPQGPAGITVTTEQIQAMVTAGIAAAQTNGQLLALIAMGVL